jgi:hypothetical protein
MNTCHHLKVGKQNPKNKLELIFKTQERLQSMYGYKLRNLKDKEKLKKSIDMILAMFDELSEIMDFLPWKPWKKYKVSKVLNDGVNQKEIRMEIIDILHFYVNLCIIWDLNPKTLYNFYISKNKENIDRIRRGYSKGKVRK